MLARMIDQNAPHHLRSDPEEMRAILPDDAILADKSDVCLVDQGGGLQRVFLPLAAEIGGRPPPQLPVDKREQVVACLEISMTPRA